MIWWGVHKASKALVNLGIVGFAIAVGWFYFSDIFDKVGRSLGLIGLGILFLAGGWALEKARRRLIEHGQTKSAQLEAQMKLAKASIALLLIQLALVSSIAGKYLYQRWRCPRVWTRTVAYDPELLMRGRYLSVQLIVDGCQSTLPSAKEPVCRATWTGVPVGRTLSAPGLGYLPRDTQGGGQKADGHPHSEDDSSRAARRSQPGPVRRARTSASMLRSTFISPSTRPARCR